LTFFGFKQTNNQADKQSIHIYIYLDSFLDKFFVFENNVFPELSS